MSSARSGISEVIFWFRRIGIECYMVIGAWVHENSIESVGLLAAYLICRNHVPLLETDSGHTSYQFDSTLLSLGYVF